MVRVPNKDWQPRRIHSIPEEAHIDDGEGCSKMGVQVIFDLTESALTVVQHQGKLQTSFDSMCEILPDLISGSYNMLLHHTASVANSVVQRTSLLASTRCD